MASSFIRRPNETNGEVVICRCAKCGALVGGSPSYRLIKVLEDMHRCHPTKQMNSPVMRKQIAEPGTLRQAK